MSRSLLSTLLVGIFIASASLTTLTTVSADEGGEGQGNEGGDSESTPAAPANDGEVHSGRGGHRGHRTNVLFAIARWNAQQYALGETAPGGFGGGDTPFSQDEIDYVCSMRRSMKSPSDALIAVVAMQMSQFMSRPAEVVLKALREPLLCTPVEMTNR